MNNKDYHFGGWLFYFTAAIIILLSIIVRIDTAVYSDMAWLFHGAEIMYNGGNFFENFFETNPPFNTIFYIPVIIFKDITGWSYNNASLLYIFPLTIIPVALILYNARYIKVFEGQKHIYYFSALLFLSLSLLATADQLGQRDIFAGLGTLLVLSAQYRYNLISYKNYKQTPIIWVSLVLGIILAFLKPHWGVLIIAAFAIRAFKEKRISIVLDFDFLLISFLTGLYLYLSLIFYPDWFLYVFPYVLKIYANLTPLSSLQRILAVCISILAAGAGSYFLAKEFKAQGNHIKIIKFFLLMTGLSLIPVILQNKGFQYHFFLSYYFLTIAFFVTLFSIFSRRINKEKRQKIVAYSTIYALTIVLFCYVFTNMARPAFFANSFMAQKIAKYSKPGDSYFIFHENMGYVFPLNLYVDRSYGSRFASYWFLANAITAEETPDISEQKAYFAHIAGIDLLNYKPKFYALQKYRYKIDNKEYTLDIVKTLSIDPLFKSEIDKYELAETYRYDRKLSNLIANKDSADNTFIEYDIYVRKED